MTALVDRLHAALASAGAHETVLLESDDRDATLAPDEVLVPAVVLVAITDRPDPGLILTVRTEGLRRHAGQIAFPGGRIDPGETAIEAALREADEEIAMPPAEVTVIGTADRYRTVTGFQVTPVIGVVPPDVPYRINDAEVAGWFEAPLAFLLEPGNHLEQAIEWQGRERHYYEINWDGHRIWGATAAMIVNLGRRLAWPH